MAEIQRNAAIESFTIVRISILRFRLTMFRLHRVGIGDTDLFEIIAPDVFDEPIQPDRLADYLSQSCNLMLVALEELDDGRTLMVGQCAAVLHMHPDKPTELYIDEVGTASTHRRLGIGRQLTKEMLVWGRERGCQAGWLGTETDNLEARALYDQLFGQGEEIMLYEFELDDEAVSFR